MANTAFVARRWRIIVLQLEDGEPQSRGGGSESRVVSGKLDLLVLAAQKVHRREMKRVQRAHTNRKGFERTREYLRRQFEECHSLQELPRQLAV